jgi:hypothetical protein
MSETRRLFFYQVLLPWEVEHNRVSGRFAKRKSGISLALPVVGKTLAPKSDFCSSHFLNEVGNLLSSTHNDFE